jgi:hypothetical protein
MKTASAIPLLLILTCFSSVEAAWKKLPGVEKRLVDIASSAVEGTRVVSSKGIGRPDALLSDDPTMTATLSEGTSEAVISPAMRLTGS